MTDATPQPDPAVTSLTAKAGDKVDNYTLMEQIGSGGTAIVFRGHDHVLNRDVAIKQLVVPPGEAGEDLRQQAVGEAAMHKQAAGNDPKLLVQYIDTVNDPRGLFIISEYIDGPSLEWMLQQERRPMEQRQALGIIAATAKALDALHQGGVVHRDLKPSNILMPREGGLKIADFGLAALIAEQQTMDLGSVRYMAPEVLQGQAASPKSDLYALGMVAYEMLAGRDRFDEAFRTILRDQRNQAMRWVKWHTNARAKVTPLEQLVDSIPPSLSQLVARMMEKDPARRVGSSAELLEAIRKHFAQAGEQAQPAGGTPPAPGPHAAMAPPKIDDASQTAAVPQKSRLPIILAATLGVCVIAIAGILYWDSQQKAKAQAEQTQRLIAAIEDADALIRDQQYEQAGSAFLMVKKDFSSEFDPDDRRYRDDLVDAGVFKADALRAAGQDDFVTALEKSRQYERMMSQWSKQPARPKTGLSRFDAEDLIDAYDARAAFQKTADKIQAMLNEGKLDAAIQAVRLTRNNATNNTAAADIRRLDGLEAQYKDLLADKRITDLLARAQSLEDGGDLDEAIELLEDAVEGVEEGEVADPRIVAMLEAFNRRDLIDRMKAEVVEAESGSNKRGLLVALRDLQQVQPTQALDVRIQELEVSIMIDQAQDELDDNQPDQAEQTLQKVLKRDAENPVAKKMLATIADAKSMAQAIRQGDQRFVEEDYPGAIKHWKDALSFGADTSGRINEKIKEATGFIHLAASRDALENGDVTLAQSELDNAKDKQGETDAIFDLQGRIDNLRDYTALLMEGDERFGGKEYGKAKVKYLAAKKIFDSDAINAKVRDCDFWIWLSQCDQSILRREWEAAESALKRAEEIKVNEQSRKRREQIANRVQ